MTILNGSHAPEDQLEGYALARLRESESVAVEEHLLLCSECRERLVEIDEFIDALRTVAPQRGANWMQRARWAWMAVPGWLAGRTKPGARGPEATRSWQSPWLVGIAVAALTLLWISPRAVMGPPQRVDLEAVRAAGGPGAEAVEGRPLDLRLHVEGLTEAGRAWEVRIVDRLGAVVYQAPLAGEGGQGQVRVDRGLPAGQYWVRLVAPESGESRREFGLTIREPPPAP